MMEFFSEFIWIKFLAEYFIKSTLVLVFALILTYICRKQPAALRHFILSVSLIGLLVFPLLYTVETGWDTGLLPSWTREINEPSNWDVSLMGHRAQPLEFSGSATKKFQSQEGKGSLLPAQNQMSNSRLWDYMKYSFLVIWLSGFVFILMRQIFGLYGAYRLSKEAEDLKSSFWRHLLNRFLEAVSVKKNVDLLHHKKVKVPLTWGWLRPVVIMPDNADVWTAEQRESALYHELSHVKRGDFIVLMLAWMSLAFYWFNPFCWLVFQLLKKEQEKACDELVLKTGIKPSTYAASLLSIRRSIKSSWNPPAAVLGAIGRSQLNDRLLAILKQRLKIKEVKMRTKIFFSALIILAIAFFGMARPASSSSDLEISNAGDVIHVKGSSSVRSAQEEQEKKKDQKKTDKSEDKDKKKDVFVWHVDKGEEGEVELIITDKGKVKSFTLKEPVIIIKKDESGKELAITSKGKAIDIKKGEGGTWVVKGDAITLHKDMEEIDLGEGAVVTLKTRTKDGQKTIEIEAPAVVVKKIDDSPKGITLKVSEEGGKKAVVVTPHVDLKHHPDVHVQMKESDLKKIHKNLQKIHERLTKKMESKTEEEEQALKEMEETLKKMEKKLNAMEKKIKDFTLSIHDDPHIVHLEHGHAISVKQKSDAEGEEKDFTYIAKDKDHLMSFVDEEGDVTFFSHMELAKTQKQAFLSAVEDLEKNLPEGYEIESEFDDDRGLATIKVKGHSISKDRMDDVIEILKGLKEKLNTKK
jgi:beta-lactamase regulating signal transducer with metallopeptidase domain